MQSPLDEKVCSLQCFRAVQLETAARLPFIDRHKLDSGVYLLITVRIYSSFTESLTCSKINQSQKYSTWIEIAEKKNICKWYMCYLFPKIRLWCYALPTS